jgi:hypothetical protein
MGGCQKCGSIGGTRTKSSRESFAHVARENVGTLIVMVQAFTQYAYDLGKSREGTMLKAGHFPVSTRGHLPRMSNSR